MVWARHIELLCPQYERVALSNGLRSGVEFVRAACLLALPRLPIPVRIPETYAIFGQHSYLLSNGPAHTRIATDELCNGINIQRDVPEEEFYALLTRKQMANHRRPGSPWGVLKKAYQKAV